MKHDFRNNSTTLQADLTGAAADLVFTKKNADNFSSRLQQITTAGGFLDLSS